MPWWSFLGVRRDIGYLRRKHAQAYGAIWEFTEAARRHLERAATSEQRYSGSTVAEKLHADAIEDTLVRRGFTRRLMPYQLSNVERLCNLPAAAAFSVPGAGKTTEALAVFALLRTHESRLVIVAPKNAFAVWEEQIGICFAGQRFAISRLTGGRSAITLALNDAPDVVIVGYQQLPRVGDLLAEYMAARPCFMFLDESHRMKAGRDGVSGAAILALSHLPTYKLVMSGTPMPNTAQDLVAQFNFLYPQVPADEGSVISRLGPIYTRTTKDQLGLAPPLRVRHKVELTPNQFRLYRALADDAARHLERLTVGDRLTFRAFARCVVHMIQAASDPALLAEGTVGGHPMLAAALAEPSQKPAAACDIARRLAKDGRKCVIWSFFPQTVEFIAGCLADLGAEFIHGGVDTSPDDTVTDSREAKLRRFHDDPGCYALIANPAACAESISLHTVCHDAIYVDRTYNAGQYLQSEDRIHRLGLPPTCRTTITVLQAEGTIDISVGRRLQAKVAAMQQVLNDAALSIRPFDLDDESIDGIDEADIADLRRLLLGS